MTEIKEINIDSLHELIESEREFVLLDIRTMNEIQQGMIPTGVIQSMRELPVELHKYTDKDALMVIYCRSGIRSYQVCEFMQDKGYNNVYNLAGGIMDWAEKGFAISQYQDSYQKTCFSKG